MQTADAPIRGRPLPSLSSAASRFAVGRVSSRGCPAASAACRCASHPPPGERVAPPLSTPAPLPPFTRAATLVPTGTTPSPFARAATLVPTGTTAAAHPPANHRSIPPPAGARRADAVTGPWRQPVAGIAAGSWTTPDLPLYGNDHDRSDFAP